VLKVFSIENDGFTEVCNMRGGKNPNLSYSSNDVAWSHIDHNLLATAATNGVVAVWDLSKFGRQKQLLVYNEHERTAHSVIFHATEAHLLISGSQDGTIKCFDMRVDKVAINTYFSNAESVRDVKFSPHAPNTFAAVSENGTIQVWDIRRADRCTLAFTAHSGPIYCCDWHPTNQWLATGSRDRLIKIWNMGLKPQLEHTIHTIANVGRVKWRPEKTYHIASCALMMDYSIYVWDIRRPYIPYISFNQHTNVTTGIAFKGNNPHCLLSTSKVCVA
jgi:WD repeat-containing protein 24